jgi:uncharacterized protein YbaR (Trm112 family)
MTADVSTANSFADGSEAATATLVQRTNQVDPDLLRILRCPLTRSPLRQDGDWLIAEVGGLRYPVQDGLPVMLMEEAQLPEGVAALEDLKRQFGG